MKGLSNNHCRFSIRKRAGLALSCLLLATSLAAEPSPTDCNRLADRSNQVATLNSVAKAQGKLDLLANQLGSQAASCDNQTLQSLTPTFLQHLMPKLNGRCSETCEQTPSLELKQSLKDESNVRNLQLLAQLRATIKACRLGAKKAKKLKGRVRSALKALNASTEELPDRIVECTGLTSDSPTPSPSPTGTPTAPNSPSATPTPVIFPPTNPISGEACNGADDDLDGLIDERIFTARNYSASNSHALWFDKFTNNTGSLRFGFRDNVKLEIKNDLTARLQGTAFVQATSGDRRNQEWSIDVQLTRKGFYPDASLGNLKISGQTPEIVALWEFFTLTSATLTRPGESLTLTMRPSTGRYPFQLGQFANNKVNELGASMDFTWVRNDGATGIGELNTALTRDTFDAEVCDGNDNNCDGRTDEGFDSDGDGRGDCIDACPSDPLKQVAGICGCGRSDTDTDGDGTANCLDNCPFNASKTSGGQCGCFIGDTDSDNDGTANCLDYCPTDITKTTLGQCGCGTPDTDSDSDGFANCRDICVNDPEKTNSLGACGCGVADTDSDGDSTVDCQDACPMDPNKSVPGDAGCNEEDIDLDNDGVTDSLTAGWMIGTNNGVFTSTSGATSFSGHSQVVVPSEILSINPTFDTSFGLFEGNDHAGIIHLPDGKFGIAGYNGYDNVFAYGTSADYGASWTLSNNPAPKCPGSGEAIGSFFTDAEKSGGYYWLTDPDFAIYRSLDGVLWEYVAGAPDTPEDAGCTAGIGVDGCPVVGYPTNDPLCSEPGGYTTISSNGGAGKAMFGSVKGTVVRTLDGGETFSVIMRSSDPDARVNSIASDGNNTWVVVGERLGSSASPLRVTFDNGQTWSTSSFLSHGDPLLHTVVYGNGKFYVGSEFGYIFESEDGLAFTRLNDPIFAVPSRDTFGSLRINRLAFNEAAKQLLAIRSDGTMSIYYSAKGIWTPAYSPSVSGAATQSAINPGAVNSLISFGFSRSPGNGKATTNVPVGNAPQSITGGYAIANGYRPTQIEFGDFTGDGIIDFAFGDSGLSRVAVYRGNGTGGVANGTFTELTTISGFRPWGLLVFDANRDGNLDIITTSYSTNQIVVIKGNGNGTFQANQFYNTGGSGAFGITRINLNNDNIPDLAVTNYLSTGVSLMVGSPGGNFTNVQSLSFVSSGRDIKTADFNNDGIEDIVVGADNSSRLSVFLHSGNGVFTEKRYTTPFRDIYAVEPFDFDNDGNVDIAVTEGEYVDTSGVYVLKGFGNGNFQFMTNIQISYSAQDVEAADFNGDNFEDFAVSNWEDSTVKFYLSNGNGTFTYSHGIVAAAKGREMRYADFDSDGTLDVVVVGPTDSDVGNIQFFYNFMNTPSRLAAFRSRYPNVYDRTVVADFNNDGIADLLQGAYQGGNIIVTLGNASGGFDTNPLTTPHNNPRYPTVGDFDEDGFLDLVVSDGLSTIQLYRGVGNGRFAMQQRIYVPSFSHYAFAIGDISGDGHNDLLVAGDSTSNPKIKTFFGDGYGQFVVGPELPGAAGGQDLDLVDLNGDGSMDILALGYSNSVYKAILSTGDGTFNTTLPVQSANGDRFSASAAAIADFNEDGIPDFVVAHEYYVTMFDFMPATPSFAVFLGNGDGTFEMVESEQLGTTNAYGITTGDFNGDSHIDIAKVGNSTEVVMDILHGDGSGNFTLGQQIGATGGIGWLHTGDFNSDNVTDILATVYHGSTALYAGSGSD